MGMENRGVTLRDLALVAVRLIGIYFVVRTLFYLPQVTSLLVSSSRVDRSTLAFFVGFLAAVVIGILLWAFADRVADALLRRSDDRTIFGESITLLEIEVVAFSLLGMFVLLNALPLLITNLAEVIAPATFDRFFRVQPGINRAAKILEVLSGFGRIAIGLWLVLGSKGFVAWLRRVRDRSRNG